MNAMAWSDCGTMGVFGKILHEDLFDGTTTIRDTFGRDCKFNSDKVKRVDMNPAERVNQLEQTLKNLLTNMESSVSIAKKAL